MAGFLYDHLELTYFIYVDNVKDKEIFEEEDKEDDEEDERVMEGRTEASIRSLIGAVASLTKKSLTISYSIINSM